MKKHPYLPLVLASILLPQLAHSQAFDVTTFDTTSAGPWSSLGKTFLMVPKVANGSVTLDGASTSAEYGGFKGVEVTPGINAWNLDFGVPLAWDNAADSSFTFFLSHDDDFFYVGVSTKDDVVNSDDDNGSFWKDDAIEMVVDALYDRLDNNTDNSKDPVGGHNYVNYEGRFSGWDDAAGTKNGSQTWASEVDWKYGKTGEIFGFGKKVTGGWQMEVRFKKNLFQSATAGNKLANGYFMGFNIGVDDDDGKLADAEKGTLSVQYFWANRARYKGVDAAYLATLTPAEKNLQVWRADADNHSLGIDSAGRLSHSGAGGVVFGYDENRRSTGKILFLCANSDDPSLGDGAFIALLQAKGYVVTVLSSGVGPDAIRAAAVGQDVVFISQSLGSGSVLEPVGDPAVQKFVLRDTDIPIISNEAFMYDNAEWTTHPEDFSNEFSFFGNTGRTEATQAVEIMDGRDSLYIRKADHPIAKGLVAGKNKVFSTHYSLNYGTPSADAKVIASVESDGKYPTLWVYEKGDKLVDGSVVPNKRIAFFLGQTASAVANWDTDVTILTQEGKTLMFNTIDYAIGKTAAAPPTISVAKSGTSVVITYAGGTLQSSATVNGTYATEAGASPLTIASPTADKFYRVKGN
ncbi:MAG: hypothetical protein EXS31_19280 [Pedosphaera sp.]|nr:hypothetical protein [Pedosphaera sp.]